MNSHGIPTMILAFALVTPLAGQRQSGSRAAVPNVSGWSNVKEMGAIGDGKTDDTVAIQRAMDSGLPVYLPPGVYVVDPTVGLKVHTGLTICGAGRASSVLLCEPKAGSVFMRPFDFKNKNPYLTDVLIRDLGIVLNGAYKIGTPSEQIGFDFRNITRSQIVNCYVGTYSLGKIPGRQDPRSKTDAIYGLGVLFGNVSSSLPCYAGGEVNLVRYCQIFGTRKAITIDDTELSPRSAAHACQVIGNDIQVCESGIAIESRYNAGTVIRDNIVQAVMRRAGEKNPTYIYRMEGMGGTLEGGYVESPRASGADYLVFLGPNSKNNRVGSFYVSTTSPEFMDKGRLNHLDLTRASER